MPLSGRTLRILCLDDQIEFLSIYQDLLQNYGHHVYAVCEPTEGLEVAEELRFDAVILSHTIAASGEYDVIRRLIGLKRDLPIILVCEPKTQIERVPNAIGAIIEKDAAFETNLVNALGNLNLGQKDRLVH